MEVQSKQQRGTNEKTHKNKKLIPEYPDIALWTDGSLKREDTDPESDENIAGAAAILKISDPDPHSTIFELEIHTTVQIERVSSSYETEIIALQVGITSLTEMNPE